MTQRLYGLEAGEPLAILPSSILAETTEGDAVDIIDYDGPLRIVLAASSSEGDDPSCAVALQESADGSTGWTAIGEEIEATDVSALVSFVINANQRKRYLRGLVTISGDGVSFGVSITAFGVKKST